MPFNNYASNLAISNRIDEPATNDVAPEAHFEFSKHPTQPGVELISRVVFAPDRTTLDDFIGPITTPTPVPSATIRMFGSSFCGKPEIHDLRDGSKKPAYVFISEWKPGQTNLNVATELIVADELDDFTASEILRILTVLIADAAKKLKAILIGSWIPT